MVLTVTISPQDTLGSQAVNVSIARGTLPVVLGTAGMNAAVAANVRPAAEKQIESKKRHNHGPCIRVVPQSSSHTMSTQAFSLCVGKLAVVFLNAIYLFLVHVNTIGITLYHSRP